MNCHFLHLNMQRVVGLVVTMIALCASNNAIAADGWHLFGKPHEPEWVILPVPNPRPNWMQSTECSWTPTNEDAKRAMSGVRDYLEKRYEKAKPGRINDDLSYILGNWNSYACQIYGNTSYEGKRVVVLNFFPKREIKEGETTWKTEEVSVKGGGAEYFRVHFDPELGAFEDFWANAPE